VRHDRQTVRIAGGAAPLSRASGGCILRAPGRPIDVERYALREGSRFDQVKRHVRAGGREQPRALPTTTGTMSRFISSTRSFSSRRSGGRARSPLAMGTSRGGRCGSSSQWWRCRACWRWRSARPGRWRKPIPRRPGRSCTVVQQISVGLAAPLSLATGHVGCSVAVAPGGAIARFG
jgi:hypothetical protein